VKNPEYFRFRYFDFYDQRIDEIVGELYVGQITSLDKYTIAIIAGLVDSMTDSFRRIFGLHLNVDQIFRVLSQIERHLAVLIADYRTDPA